MVCNISFIAQAQKSQQNSVAFLEHSRQKQLELVPLEDIEEEDNIISNNKEGQTFLKFTSSTTELLDSVVTLNSSDEFISKTIYKYNINDNLILLEYYNWNNIEEEWTYYQKTDYVYNSNGHVMIVSRWDSNNKLWRYSNKVVKEYNSNGDQTLYEHYHWTDSWVYSSKEETEWDTDNEENKTKIYILYIWDDILEQLQPDYKKEAVFHGNSDEYKQEIIYKWSDEMWVPFSKFEQLHDDDGYDQTMANYTWNTTSNHFEGNSKSGYVFNDDKSIKIQTTYQWDSQELDWKFKTEVENGTIRFETEYTKEGETWLPVSRIGYDGDYVIHYNLIDNIFVPNYKEISYYSNDNLISYLRYNWDTENQDWYKSHHINNQWDNLTGSWKIFRKVDQKYDLSGHTTCRIQLYRPDSSSPWDEVYTYKQERKYNDIGQQLTYTLFYWIEEDWDDENPNNSGWQLNKVSNYYYSAPIPTSTSQMYTVELHTYPNPVINNLTISGTLGREVIQVYDTNGVLIETYMASKNKTEIDVSNLNKGIYILNIEGASYKIIKE